MSLPATTVTHKVKTFSVDFVIRDGIGANEISKERPVTSLAIKDCDTDMGHIELRKRREVYAYSGRSLARRRMKPRVAEIISRATSGLKSVSIQFSLLSTWLILCRTNP